MIDIQKYKSINFDKWKCRCSSISKINPKNGNLTQGVQTYLKEEYNRIAKEFKEDFTSKYTEKGKWKEEDVLDMMQNTILKGKLPIKNKELKENDYIKGTCDVFMPKLNLILDAKNSYSWKTFDNAELTDAYEWQLRGYMWLWSAEKSILYYALLNLPEHQLLDLERKLFYSSHEYLTMENTQYLEDCKDLRENWNFEKFPESLRYKTFQVEREEKKETDIVNMVIKCREWLNEYHLKQIVRL